MTRSAGSRSVLDVLLRRRRSSQGDEAAVANGEARTVTCFLRASFGRYPRRFRQGVLTLEGSEAAWRPYWSLRRRSLAIADSIQSVAARPRDKKSDWNIKPRGLHQRGGLLQTSGFTVVVLSTATGTIEMAVPSVDQVLVAGFFRPAR